MEARLRPPESRRPPRELVWLLVAVAISGACWSYANAPFQAPDENTHFAYVQHLAETGHRTENRRGSSFGSTEQLVGSEAINSDQVAALINGRPVWSRITYDRWRARSFGTTERRNGYGVNPAGKDPP